MAVRRAGNKQLMALVAAVLLLVAGATVAGALLATATLPQADRLQDRLSAQIGLDDR